MEDTKFNLGEFLDKPLIPPKKEKEENKEEQHLVDERVVVSNEVKPEKKNKYKAKNKYNIIISAVLILLCALAIQNFMFHRGGEKICIAKQCTDWLSGDEWVTSNCRPQNNTLMCKIYVNEQEVNIPLQDLNISNVKSCRKYNCVAKVMLWATEDIYS